jgi:hypothetical protein
VGKWDEIIDRAVNTIGSETFGWRGYRENVGHYLFEAECGAAEAPAADINEKAAKRVSDMQAELLVRLNERRKGDSEKKIWELAVTLLRRPNSRAKKDQWHPSKW